MRLARRIEGRVVHVGDSRSARFWVILKTDENHEYFGYGKSFIVPTTPAIGQRFTFTPLPPRAGSKYLRAIVRAADLFTLANKRWHCRHISGGRKENGIGLSDL